MPRPIRASFEEDGISLVAERVALSAPVVINAFCISGNIITGREDLDAADSIIPRF